jgi:hypothetical protein
MKRLRVRFGRVLGSVILACATTVGVAWGLALWMPVAQGRGVVSLDGDHLQPWILRVERPGAERFIYFEKGRVYSRQNVGPPNANSSAVACWSFATGTRTDAKFVRGTVAVPTELEEEMARQPRTAWGVALDRRGWPLAAFECMFVGTTATDSPQVYVVVDGVRIEAPPQKMRGGMIMPGGSIESLADIRALPVRPVWKGLVVNTGIAIVAWYVVLSGVSMVVGGVKSALRKPAGHCPKCDYDLKGNLDGGCPECGWNRETVSADGGASARPP